MQKKHFIKIPFSVGFFYQKIIKNAKVCRSLPETGLPQNAYNSTAGR